jgi:glutamyl-tRNA synthetase
MSAPWGELAARAERARAAGRRGRYAPSPTGPLHLGNVRTGLASWVHARRAGAAFVLRIEDVDEARAVPGSAEQILDDLRWLGLDWDEGPDVGGPLGPYTQSERVGLYEEARARLVEAGLAYPCWCSRREVRERAAALRAEGVALGRGVYPGTCRGLDESGRAARAAERGLEPVWRFRVGAREVVARDERLGELAQRLGDEVGDVIIKRRDGFFAYQLAVVVDDALMGITDVVRGEDLWDSTPRQIALHEALGFAPPERWRHEPLMLGEDGRKLSKRDGSRSLGELRAEGATPEEVVGRLAASLGWVERGRALSAGELLEELGG